MPTDALELAKIRNTTRLDRFEQVQDLTCLRMLSHRCIPTRNYHISDLTFTVEPILTVTLSPIVVTMLIAASREQEDHRLISWG